MVRASTIVLVVGVGLLFVPIPPVATILGALVILAGAGLRILTDH
ncbi:transporter [Natrinema gelatinilyticum]|nr:transporter [Natrinema gelatinilyticum]